MILIQVSKKYENDVIVFYDSHWRFNNYIIRGYHDDSITVQLGGKSSNNILNIIDGMIWLQEHHKS